jgi:Prasinovirus endonuclease VII
MMKLCKKCKITKEKSFFPKNKRYKDGYDPLCKDCRNELNKNYRDANKDLVSSARKKYYSLNLVKFRKEKRAYYANNKKQKSIYDVDYRKRNQDKIRSYKKSWESKNKDIIHVKIKRNLRRRLCHVISRSNKSSHTMELLGCSIEWFLGYIERQFVDGMSWENYGRTGWHIDHIRPCFKFDLTKLSEQRKCFHFMNLRPLWWQDNLSRKMNI